MEKGEKKKRRGISSTKEATDYQKLVSNGPRAIPSAFRMSSLGSVSRTCLMWGGKKKEKTEVGKFFFFLVGAWLANHISEQP